MEIPSVRGVGLGVPYDVRGRCEGTEGSTWRAQEEL